MGERSLATRFLLQQLCIRHLSAKVKYFVYFFFRFAKSHAKRAYVPTCLRASMVYVPTCLCASAVYAAICLRANLQKACQLVIWRTNVPINVPLPYGVPMFQLGVPMCQKTCRFFKHSSYEMLREISIIYHYKNILHYTWHYSYTLSIWCIAHKNCLRLHFYTSCHTKERCLDFFSFLLLFSFSALYVRWGYT